MNGSPPWRQSLLNWYRQNARDLPWRRTRDPYAIWMSEVMLQQTQIATGLPYYERWMRRFPTVDSLAVASEEDVLAMWQGLGYYRRARLIRQGAQFVMNHGWPRSAAEWQQVPSVGPYTAGALASITLHEAAAVVDGNVERVYSRVTGDAATKPDLHRNAWTWAKEHVDRRNPGDWNQALMELGALVCRPMNPRCSECPIREHCVAFQLDKTAVLPTKPKRSEVRELVQYVWVPICDRTFGIRQVPPGGWWEGFYEFPRESDESALAHLLPNVWRESLGTVRHTVTNHRITLVGSLVRVETPIVELKWLTPEALADIPMAAPQRKLLRIARAH